MPLQKNITLSTFNHHDLTLLNPAFDSPLADIPSFPRAAWECSNSAPAV
jgi:hypothetical protein